MANKNIFITGNTDLIILSILKKEDTYAYDIVKQVVSLSEGMLELSGNTIYTAIYKLENNSYISEYTRKVGNKRTRVYYHLEEQGKRYLDELLDSYLKTMKGTNQILKNLYCIKENEEHE